MIERNQRKDGSYMGLGAPFVSPEDMRNFNLCSAIQEAGIYVADAIKQAADKSCNVRKEIAEENRKSDYANTKLMVDAILSGSSYIERGMQQIASELRYSNILTERRDLETKIKNIEDWLFERGFLKEFYQTTKLYEEVIPFVKGNYYYFLNEILKIDSKLIYISKDNIEKVKRALEELKNQLCEFSLNMMCHPLVTLAYLISRNGLRATDITYSICGTNFEWEGSWSTLKTKRNENGHIHDFGEYEITFKKVAVIPEKYVYIADLTFEEALKHLIHVAKEFERNDEKLDVRLEWDAFFAKLNMHIAMFNLRMLAQSLENFKRQKQLEILS